MVQGPLQPCCDTDPRDNGLSIIENSKIKVLYKALHTIFQEFKKKLIFKNFSRKPSIFKYLSSRCES